MEVLEFKYWKIPRQLLVRMLMYMGSIQVAEIQIEFNDEVQDGV